MSGSGFPSRPSRAAFPNPIDRQPVVDPARQLGAATGKLMFWQIAGLGVVSPRAVAIVDDTGALISHAEAWDPNGVLAPPTAGRTSAGLYTLDYPATVPDESGASVALVFVGGMVTPQGSDPHFGMCELAVGLHGMKIHTFFHDGAADDAAFMIAIW